MKKFPIGVMLESFRLDFAQGVQKAAEVGAKGLQIYATGGDMAPENMTPASIQEKKRIISENGLVISALCGDLGGFSHVSENPARIEKSKRILDLALELGCRIVTTHLGVIPEDPGHDRYKIMQEACSPLSEYAQSIGACLAAETGCETVPVLKQFIDSIGSKGLRVNYDPANLVMVAGIDPVEGVRILGDYIVHTHAKDGIQLQKFSPEKLFGSYEGEILHGDQLFRELPLGQGAVDFGAYLAALEEVGYDGFLTIEREMGDDPEADIRLAVGFLREKMRG